MSLTFGSLFAGIGGFDLGLERAGLVCKWQVEKSHYNLKILDKHWPNVPKYTDVHNVGKQNLEPVDLVCGGFPCQPFSKAGKQRGAEDDRNLWPEMARVVSELRPTWVLGENVPGIRKIYLDTVLSDLEDMGYSTATFNIPAVAFDARHVRHRLYIVAHADWKGLENWKEGKQHDDILPIEYSGVGIRGQRLWPAEPNVDRVADGIPGRVDRIRSLGNAVVPQVAEFFGYLIKEASNVTNNKEKM